MSSFREVLNEELKDPAVRFWWYFFWTHLYVAHSKNQDPGQNTTAEALQEKEAKVNYYISDLHWRVRSYEHIR